MPFNRLGGFKVLKGVAYVCAILSNESAQLIGLFDNIAYNKINLPFITCVSKEKIWGLNIAFEEIHLNKIKDIFNSANIEYDLYNNCSILSIFPHRKDPEILLDFLDIFNEQKTPPYAIASSPSAISVIIKADALNGITEGLFSKFSFSAYRTPEDWMLSQKGKETLYKEVVASFQEKRPKVYGLEYINEQSAVNIDNGLDIAKHLSRSSKYLLNTSAFHFICSSPLKMGGDIFITIPTNDDTLNKNWMQVSVFSMSGPHFGDRYGIARLLIDTLLREKLKLLAMNCTIASLSWVVHSKEIKRIIKGIGYHFDIPTIRCLTD